MGDKVSGALGRVLSRTTGVQADQVILRDGRAVANALARMPSTPPATPAQHTEKVVEQNSELLEAIRANVAQYQEGRPQDLKRLEKAYGPELGRLIAALGGAEVVGDDVVLSLLATDADARQAAMSVDAESHPEFFEALVGTLAARYIRDFIRGELRPRPLGHRPVDFPEQVETHADVQERLAEQMAERARLFMFTIADERREKARRRTRKRARLVEEIWASHNANEAEEPKE